MKNQYILSFESIGMEDLPIVGGKNASLGEMIQNLAHLGVEVPTGFATTAFAYRAFLAQEGLDARIEKSLELINIEDTQRLSKLASQIRAWIINTPFQPELITAVTEAYHSLSIRLKQENITVAVRSSATAEDLPNASFAGQQETFLNISGIDNILLAIKQVYASLYTDRAIAYRVHHGFHHHDVALSVGIQQMVRSDLGASGVLFSIDTESGFDQVVFITSSYGLGELIVQGVVNPDEFYVYKPNLAQAKPAILSRHLGSKLLKMVYVEGESKHASMVSVKSIPVPISEQNTFSLSDQDVLDLAKKAVIIEQHYQRAMDIEWAKDGITGKLYILQARPETVQSQKTVSLIERYSLKKTGLDLKPIIEGRAIGNKIGSGTARLIASAKQMHEVQEGEVLVTDMTDPDWEPIMKRASAIVTNRGGRTCHAAIIARELGIPAVVGCGNATGKIHSGDKITVSCAEGDTGFVYSGILAIDIQKTNIEKMPDLDCKIMMNVGNPERAFDFAKLPNSGVGLARVEFLISQTIGIHPKACLEYEKLPKDIQSEIKIRTAGYPSPKTFYISKLIEGLSMLGAAFFPKPVIIRFSDFKSNEYANLIGGKQYEPYEENPMLGFRGASRYVSESFKSCFALECEAAKYVRDKMGLTNIQLMIPFVRTVSEMKAVIDILATYGLKRGENNLKIIMMCELPTNALLAEAYLEHCDGFSIGSNDLTQLTLGLDRDSGVIADQFNERDEAVKILISKAIQACKKAGKYIGICGQGPSDHPDFAEWLIKEGIDSISLNPDTVLQTWLYLAKK